MAEKKSSKPDPQPYDWHPREVVQDLSEIDYGFEYNGCRHQKQVGPPIKLDHQNGRVVLLIPVFRDAGPAAPASRLEWHLSKWALCHGVWRRQDNLILRAHQLEALCGAWWSGELEPYVGLDYAALKKRAGIQRGLKTIPWWCQAGGRDPDEPDPDDYG